MEVMAGARGDGHASTRAFLHQFQLTEITQEIAEAAFEVRQTLSLKLPDATILATSRTTHRLLVTRNTRDLKKGVRVPDNL
jgi:predicted nucleic acid-binding protein